jgi:hypothetical protein
LYECILYGPQTFGFKVLEDSKPIELLLRFNPDLTTRLEAGRVWSLIRSIMQDKVVEDDTLTATSIASGSAGTTQESLLSSGLSASLMGVWIQIEPSHHSSPPRARTLDELLARFPPESNLTRALQKYGAQAVALGGYSEVWRAKLIPTPTIACTEVRMCSSSL